MTSSSSLPTRHNQRVTLALLAVICGLGATACDEGVYLMSVVGEREADGRMVASGSLQCGYIETDDVVGESVLITPDWSMFVVLGDSKAEVEYWVGDEPTLEGEPVDHDALVARLDIDIDALGEDDLELLDFESGGGRHFLAYHWLQAECDLDSIRADPPPGIPPGVLARPEN